MRIFWTIVAACVVIVLGAWVYFSYFKGEQLTVEFEQGLVERGDIESVVIATGELKPVNEVIVGSEISGQISELLVDFNDDVSDGQILARIDPRTYEARLLQRQADVESAEAVILSREAELQRSRSNLRQATRQLNRNRDLSEQGHVSESQLDNDINQVESSTSALEIAESQIITAKSGLTQAQASLAQAELDLERTYIRSPVSGTVISRNVELGQTVAASLQAPELFIIANDLREMQVEASVDEADIGLIQEGMRCRFTVDAYPEREFAGSIEQVRKAHTVQANVVTYKVIITALNADLALLPGMTANVEIVLGQRSDILKVANSALRYQPKEGIAILSTAGTQQTSPSRGGGGFGGPGGGRQNPVAMLNETLNLTADQQSKVESIYADMRETMRTRMASMGGGGGFGRPGGGSGGGGPNNGMREMMRSMMSQVNDDIEKILTPEQKSEFRKMASGRSSQRRETVYVLNEDGVHVEKRVVVGLQDDSSAEVIEGLEEGDQVVIRARRIG